MMTPRAFKAARQSLAKSVSEMARLLGTTPTQIRRLEAPEGHGMHRRVLPAMERRIRGLLSSMDRTK